MRGQFMTILSLTSRVSMAIATHQLLSLILTVSFLSLPLACLTILVAPSQTLAQTAEDRRIEAERLLQQGTEPLYTNESQAVLQPLQQALEIYRSIGDRIGEIAALNHIGSYYDTQGQYVQALEIYQQVLAVAQEINNQQSEQIALDNIGRIHSSLAQYTQAIEYHQQAFRLAEEMGDREIMIQALQGLELPYTNLGQPQRAIEIQQQSLAIAQEIGDRNREISSLQRLGFYYRRYAQYQSGVEFFQQVLEQAQQTGDYQKQGIALGILGDLYQALEQDETAIEFFEQALVLLQKADDLNERYNLLLSLGASYRSLGQFQQASESYQQALAIAREMGESYRASNIPNPNSYLEVQVLNILGHTYQEWGQYQKAAEFFQLPLEIARRDNNRQEEMEALINLGSVYQEFQDYQRVDEFMGQALSIAREMGDRNREEYILTTLGVNYRYSGQPQQAIESLQQALALSGNRNTYALSWLSQVYLDLEQYPQSIDILQQILALARQENDRGKEFKALTDLGDIYFRLGQYQQAIVTYQQAQPILQEYGERNNEFTSTYWANLGFALLAVGKPVEAEPFLIRAIEGFESFAGTESLRTGLRNDSSRIFYFERQRYAYQALQMVLILQNRIDEALEIAERGRAKALLGLLNRQLAPDVVTASATPLPRTTSEQIEQIAKEQDATLVQYSVINIIASTPIIYIWVISPTGEIAFRSVELNEENQQILSGAIATAFEGSPIFRGDSTTISNLVSSVRPTNRSASRDIELEYSPSVASDNLRQLHQLLIEPIADLLPTNESDRIVFIPQEGLFLVPFAALQDANGDYLIEKHTISIAPSIQVLDITQQQRNNERSPQNALIVGNPTMPQIWDTQTSTEVPLAPLPGAEREAQAIAQFLNTEAITGEAATETAITEQMPAAQIIHLATHGLLEYGIPSDSGVLDVPGAIALTPSSNEDGLLTSAEILEMDLQAELVVLSACDTGRGRITGDGVVGLSRALISAGAPSVIVSLWSVPDAPTAELMTEFYRQLETQPDKAQALRQAMLITMRQHPDPRDWAAFTIIGEAR
jgi:CHAT domain-containing protein/uncharacterized protein HemY